MKKTIFIIIGIIAVISAYFLYSHTVKTAYFTGGEATGAEREQAPAPPPKTDRVETVKIEDGDTYGKLMDNAGVGFITASDVYNAAEPDYDLAKIRVGREIKLTYDKDSDELIGLNYQIDSEDELNVVRISATSTESGTATATPNSTAEAEHTWQAEVAPIPYEVKIKTAGGTVESSMYQAALDNDIDIRAIIALANVFQWSIDFAMDPRVGDTFKFIYEERYLNGEYVMPGRILAGEYVNAGMKYQAYYFEESAENTGYFDENGNSVQKMFLKAPVEFRYISSGYTTGNRVVMELGMSGPHRAIDYAAAMGTPIRAVGDGTVTFAGWNSHGYGNLTSIRHNATYSTNYGHQSKIIVRVGQKVKQGQVIGYVGSTGNSTGPHVHFEMVKNGVKINPLTEVLPPGTPIKDENRERFNDTIKDWQEMLNK